MTARRFSWATATATAMALAIPVAPIAQPRGGAPSTPSFACAKAAGTVEAAICATPALAAADRTMAQLYAVAGVSAFGTGPSNELAAQRTALAAMRRCAAPPANGTTVSCLQARYDDRLNELAIAALMRSPELALPALRRTDPVFAPILEAVRIWASEPKDADWASPQRAAKRAHIVQLLTPTMQNLLTRPDQSFGREILTSPSGDGIAVRRLEDVFISERHFAAFLDVVGPYLDDAGPHGARTLPCAAIVLHPALLAATASVFGSTMDNFVLRNDCGEALPPTPALTILGTKLIKRWPVCEGTIRFAAYRMYETSVDAARLGLGPRGQRTIPHRRGVTASDIGAAQRELAGYYAGYLRHPPATAGAMAKAAVADIMNKADSCGA